MILIANWEIAVGNVYLVELFWKIVFVANWDTIMCIDKKEPFLRCCYRRYLKKKIIILLCIVIIMSECDRTELI